MKQKWIIITLLTAILIGILPPLSYANGVTEHQSQSLLTAEMKGSAVSTEQLAYSLGIQAYIYGYPLVIMEQTKQMMLKKRAPINQFYYSQALATPEFRDIVTPNSNTLYFTAWLDLSHGPVVLQVPENRSGRYYTVQMLDMYTNTFQNVSNRLTGNKAGQYAIVGPTWSGSLSLPKIAAPTNSVWLIGRVEVAGPDDMARAAAFEKEFTLSSSHRRAERQHMGQLPDVDLTSGKHPLAFYKVMTEVIKQNPPPPCDQVLLDQFKLIGIDPAKGFEPKNLSPAILAGLIRAAKDAQSIIVHALDDVPTVNGWIIGYGIGTYGNQFLLRAVVAYSGLGANVPSEELYARANVDHTGQTLNGANRYVLHFDKDELPAVSGFWSLTAYNPDFTLVSNPINRYSIGDLTKGLQVNPDGSLDLYIQHTPPAGKEANWLPAPSGDFNLVLRMFAPKPSMLDRKYRVPPVMRMK